MNRTKSIFVAASILLALAFTTSCSGDGGGGNEDTPSSSSLGGAFTPSSSGGGISSGGGTSSGGGSSSSAVPQRTLTINIDPTAGGTVSNLPVGTSHENGTTVAVTATAKLGYAFTGWSGAATGTTNPVSITMDGNKDLTANFALTNSGTFTDPRDSKTYEWVRIGGKIWLAKNLNFAAPGSKCGDSDSGELSDDPSKCADYGRLYNWEAAMSACPSGLHLPSNAEWDELYAAAEEDPGACSEDYCPTAGKHLKSKTGWQDCGPSGGSSYSCEDTYGFSALPGGNGGSDGYFGDAGYYGSWWSSSEYEFDSDIAYIRDMGYDFEGAVRGYDIKTALFSVRCVQTQP